MTASTGAGFILCVQPGERLEQVDAALAGLDPADGEEEEPAVGPDPRRGGRPAHAGAIGANRATSTPLCTTCASTPNSCSSRSRQTLADDEHRVGLERRPGAGSRSAPAS